MTRRTLAAALLLAVVLLPLAAQPRGVAAEADAMRDEDVVRMWVAGASERELIERIQAAETAFDLSDEMVEELRFAGLPAAVVDAMKARQAEIDAARAPAEPIDEPPPPTTRIVVALSTPDEPGDDGEDSPATPSLRLVGVLDEAMARALGVDPEDRAIDDIAVFLACATQDHVPDQWRNASPLGRDFVSVPRHRMLAFVSGAGGSEPPARGMKRRLAQTLGLSGDEVDALSMLRLELPTALEAEVEPAVSHDVVIGIAVHTPSRWLAISLDVRAGIEVEADAAAVLTATIDRERAPLAATTTISFE